MFWDYFWVIVRNLGFAALLIYMLAPERPSATDERQQLLTVVGARQFDFATWEFETILDKSRAALAAGHNHLTAEQQKELVIEFVQLIAESRRLEREIEQIYTNPDINNPDDASADLQAEHAAVRQRLADIQPLAEAVVEQQISAVLLDEGFGFAGRVWPPVQMHLTPLPSILIVSPREEIDRIASITLENGIPTPERAEFEAAVFNQYDRSAYITNIGGLGTYPAMIIETSSINFLMDVVAHEWSHHWMAFYPVGLNYAISGEVRTINESSANIVGREIGAEVIRRYYPEYAPPPPPENPPTPAEIVEPNAPPPFDFRAEMAETRIEADRLLAEGQIEAAEFYMEARRRIFLENGYNLRVLNQAYFAFHGAYADQGGATGSDPIGPLVNEVRSNSDSLKAFLENIRSVASLADLQAIAAELETAMPAE